MCYFESIMSYFGVWWPIVLGYLVSRKALHPQLPSPARPWRVLPALLLKRSASTGLTRPPDFSLSARHKRWGVVFGILGIRNG